MNVLGIESTAHTASIGLVRDGEIIALKSHTYKPQKGGINPKEAADHHRTFFPVILNELLDDSDIKLKDLDKIGVSTSPGLGPSLKTGVSLARYLSQKLEKPVVSVNHGVGHLEISRKFSGFKHPVFLYVSGGNTQLIASGNNRYSVLGETLDIGVGNFLDKIGRDLGFPFPGAPRIEMLAKDGDKVLDCPYVVKGMDVSFSGLYTFLRNRIAKERKEDIAFNAQEYAFTALVEIVERGLAHFGLNEFSATGGVARNRRLRDLLVGMADMRGYSYYFPEDRFLSDNGAMIALAAYMGNRTDKRLKVEQSARVDSKPVPWIGKHSLSPRSMVGGESIVTETTFNNVKGILKSRKGREYRNKQIDQKVNLARMKREIKLMNFVKNIGIRTPTVLFVDPDNLGFVMEELEATNLSTLIRDVRFNIFLEQAGEEVAKFHASGSSHGDLNIGNIMVGRDIYFIDFSMGELSAEEEDIGVDIHLMKESLKSLGKGDSFASFLEGYKKFERFKDVMKKVNEIEERRRYT